MDYIDYLLKNIEIGESTKIEYDLEIYNKKTLFRTCYKFTDKVFVYIKDNDISPNKLDIYFTKKEDTVDLFKIIDEFTNELLDQQLRQVVIEDTKKIRETIVTRALLSGQPK